MFISLYTQSTPLAKPDTQMCPPIYAKRMDISKISLPSYDFPFPSSPFISSSKVCSTAPF